MISCSFCGTVYNSENIKYCGFCGKKISSEIKKSDISSEIDTEINLKPFNFPKEKINNFFNKKNLILLSILLITITLVFSGLNILKKQNSPENIANKYVNFLLNENYSKAYEHIYIPNENVLLNEESYINFIKDRFPINTEISSKKEINNNNSETEKFYEYILNEKKYSIRLIKHQERWKVSLKDNLTDWYINVPANAKVEINNIDLISKKQNNVSSVKNKDQDLYIIDNILPTNYKLKVSLPGAETLIKEYVANEPLIIKLKVPKEIKKEMTIIYEKVLNLYYLNEDNANKEEYKNLLSENGDLYKKITKENFYDERKNFVYLKLKNFEIIDEEFLNNKAIYTIETLVNYEKKLFISFNNYKEEIGTKKYINKVVFINESGKWLLDSINFQEKFDSMNFQ